MVAILAIFFSAPPEALEHPAHGGVAHRDTARPSQERAALGEGGGRALSLRSASRSLRAVSPIFGLEPGRLFGASVRPSAASLA
jgi:hypothetical protein